MPSDPLFSPQTGRSLRHANTFGLEARAAHWVEAGSDAEIAQAAAFAQAHGLPLLVLGGGSNLVLTRDFPGLVLAIRTRGRRLLESRADAWIVEAAAGEPWHAFVGWSLEEGFPGLENLALIPGTVGAAPIQNIGAYGVELAERLESVRVMDRRSGTVEELSVSDCRLGYRDSVFKHARQDAIVLSVRFRLPRPWRAVTGYKDVAAQLQADGIAQPGPRDIFDAVTAVRTRKLPDPALIGNVGSFFKNPVVRAEQWTALRAVEPEAVGYPQGDGTVKLAAAWLIDRCGLKGRAFGQVGVHPQQALVLVNLGGATGAEVLAAARAIQEAVEHRFGIRLEPEPVIV